MNKIARFLISLYKQVPIPSRCIYIPSCSQYAEEAFLRYPFFKACGKVIFRILRCHPFSCGGYDPVEK